MLMRFDATELLGRAGERVEQVAPAELDEVIGLVKGEREVGIVLVQMVHDHVEELLGAHPTGGPKGVVMMHQPQQHRVGGPVLAAVDVEVAEVEPQLPGPRQSSWPNLRASTVFPTPTLPVMSTIWLARFSMTNLKTRVR